MDKEKQTKKLSADCTETLFNLVSEAAGRERRKISDFIRLAVEDRSNKILEVNSQ